jgi:hypothetical protein
MENFGPYTRRPMQDERGHRIVRVVDDHRTAGNALDGRVDAPQKFEYETSAFRNGAEVPARDATANGDIA